MLEQLSRIVLGALGGFYLLFAAYPTTTHYTLNSYSFGSGGVANATTSNYGLEGITGEVSGKTTSTSNYSTEPGFIETQQANVPTVTLSNPANYYNKLKFVINTQNNPTDALYALQVSTTSNFSSSNSYVQSDDTLSPTLTLADYQTYTAWGGASGANIIGLAANTTYYIRVKATQGKYTESAYGPSSNASTVGQQLSYCVYTNANCAAGGNSIAFGNMPPITIATSPNNIGVDFATNANSGGNVYIYSANGGLRSTSASYTINSATANLSIVNEGFGGQIVSVNQSSGGPLSGLSPYNGSGNSVGALATTVTTIFTSSNPLTGGTGSILLKALPSSTTPSATDYHDVLTLIAAANF